MVSPFLPHPHVFALRCTTWPPPPFPPPRSVTPLRRPPSRPARANMEEERGRGRGRARNLSHRARARPSPRRHFHCEGKKERARGSGTAARRWRRREEARRAPVPPWARPRGLRSGGPAAPEGPARRPHLGELHHDGGGAWRRWGGGRTASGGGSVRPWGGYGGERSGPRERRRGAADADRGLKRKSERTALPLACLALGFAPPTPPPLRPIGARAAPRGQSPLPPLEPIRQSTWLYHQPTGERVTACSK